MKWLKLGKIFDCAYNNKLFAQSPQALVFDDFIRIYYSTREKDGDKYLSHVAFVDMERDFSSVVGVSTKPVLPLGELGCFDEHGIFPFSPIKEGRRILAYTTGWSRRSSVSVDTSIGLATSYDDGVTFHRIGNGPVLSSSLNEPFLIGDGFVKPIDGILHMWYIAGTKWKLYNGVPERIYKINHAISSNRIDWEKKEQHIIPTRLGEDECQALPSVIKINNLWHMLFCYRLAFDFRTNSQNSYKIGHATSRDLITWKRKEDPLPTSSPYQWDSNMMCYPNVFKVDKTVYMLYNGNEFGKHGFGLAVLIK